MIGNTRLFYRPKSAQVPWEHLKPWPDARAEDSAAWKRYAADLTTTYALISSGVLASAVVLWWPLDLVVSPHPEYVEAFFTMRVGLLAVLSAVVGLILWVPWARDHALVLAVVGYAAVMGVIGYALGQAGGPHLPWLADAFMGVLPSALIPLSLAFRIGATALIAGALAAGFFLPWPWHLENPFAMGQLSFLAFAACFTIAAGELIERTVRRSFFQSRSLERARAGLAEEVEARTSELRHLAAHLDDVLETERARLSRELHDELGQEFSALRLTLERVEQRYDVAPDALAPLLARLGHQVDRVSGAIRRTVMGLRPQLVDTLGLSSAIDSALERARSAGLVVEVAPLPERLDQLPRNIQHDAFRAVQEAVTNVLRHAQASRLRAQVELEAARLWLTIDDDGRGFSPENTPGGFGLVGMRERIRARGGTVSVNSVPGHGTQIHVALPLRAAEENE
jgi:signal transduction histidine kinase